MFEMSIPRLRLTVTSFLLAGSLLVACAPGSAPISPITSSTATPTSQSAPAVGVAPPVSGGKGAPSGIAVSPPVPVAAPGIAPAPSNFAQGAPAAGAAAAPASSVAASVVGQAIPPVPSSGSEFTRGIVVTGNGSVTAQPDQAVVSAGVMTRGQTAQSAQADNNQQMTAVLAAIKALGVQDKDIQTSGLSLYPIENQSQFVTGYSASNNLTIVVQDISLTGKVLDAAITAGANQSVSVRFAIKDQSGVRNQALAAAATDARAKADVLAGALGLKVTGVVSVSEQSSSQPYSVAPRALGAAAAAPSVPIESGELSVTASVTVVFAY